MNINFLWFYLFPYWQQDIIAVFMYYDSRKERLRLNVIV
jgi:hypothetical protein